MHYAGNVGRLKTARRLGQRVLEAAFFGRHVDASRIENSRAVKDARLIGAVTDMKNICARCADFCLQRFR